MTHTFLSAHRYSREMARPPAYPALDSEARINARGDITGCQTLLHLIWSCLLTIFLCAWVSLRLNVPPPKQGVLARFWRKLRMMLIALIVPELILGFAARQYVIADWFTTGAKCFILSMRSA
ncbi:hypothetical protein DFH07DRAFT_918404 [Mycena maculata]|uniref:Uncharacterized protein n=1 Tax=Mycena maculata TaxID=230809 RepID=A0AAD7JF86_9AGAR|nr:hypothetical protein DFH07DRAFT_918404 [Mycena maculata]